jgi:hypothetical protein
VSAIADAGPFLSLDSPEPQLPGTPRRAGVFAGQFGATAKGPTMLGRHVYRVLPTEAGWIVTKEGEDRPRARSHDREKAIAEAVRLAGSEEPAKVTVDSGDGTIAEEWLFGSDAVEELGA